MRRLLLSFCFAASLPALAAGAPRPNIVLILADDLGISDLGCYGSEIPTPNLDRLAAQGLRFTQFYNTGRCCPTRASLLTGLYPHQAGIGHMVESRGLPGYQGFLNDRCVTIAEALRTAGYRTWMSGKWHVGERRPHWPVDRGFESSFALISGGTNYFRLDPERLMAEDDRPYVPSGEGYYITDAITRQAVARLEEHGKKPEPFFLYVAYTAPHWPLHAPAEDIARHRGKYKDGWDALRESRRRKMIELGIIEERWGLSPRDPQAPSWETALEKAGDKDKDQLDLKMAVYAAQIDRMDQGIGKILDKVREIGAEENTLVMFLADNGGCAEEVRRGKPGAPPGEADSFLSYGLPWAGASNTPFRLFKHWVHEGGISTPMIIRWPQGKLREGGLVREPGHLIDVMATCLDAAGAPYPKTIGERAILPLEGRSLLPLARGEAPEFRDALYWEHEGNRAVRQGKWKLVARFDKPWELYDLEVDRCELADLSGRFPEKSLELARLYYRWAERSGVEPWSEVRSRTDRTLDIYFIDTEGGASTLVVTPAGESLLFDCGNAGDRDPARIAAVVREVAGLKRIDACFITHWHSDHVGGAARLSELVPIERFYDHGYPRSPDADHDAQGLKAYRRIAAGKSMGLLAGNEVRLRSEDGRPAPSLRVLAADGLVIGETEGAAPIRPCGRGHDPKPEDPSDNARSLAFRLSYGDFDFFDGGDLTWNIEHKLVCPDNLAGPVDVFQVNHHGLDLSNNPALIEALAPKVAVFNNGPRKGAEPGTYAALKKAAGIEAIFQLHRNVRTGDAGNTSSEQIANDDEKCSAFYIKLSVAGDGKSYSIDVPAKGTRRTFSCR